MTFLSTSIARSDSALKQRTATGASADIALIDRNHPQRHQVEAFITRRFRDAHGARISNFMPQLIAIFNHNGDVLAALGLRNAAKEPLFLEQYLDAPLEQLLSAQSGDTAAPAQRGDIVEIGNLASIDRRASRRLFGFLAGFLISEGYQWATFTGCPSLRKIFNLLGIDTFSLGEARVERLAADQRDWGSYYDDKPEVLAGRVVNGKVLLSRATSDSTVEVAL